MKLYVGNLDYSVTGDQLQQLFAEVGPVVSAVVISDRNTGRSKGFGFVEMADADAKKAMEKYNDFDLQGRKLRVNEARPLQPRAPFQPGRPQ
jgi:RNA recognition motif-containing protein